MIMEEQIMETLKCLNMHSCNSSEIHNYNDNWRAAAFLPNMSAVELIKEGDGMLDSREQSVDVEDTFGLEFAALQWLNLVTNAEQLFNKLMNSILLTGDEKEQIQRWLCLKQECEDCVASDEATSFGEHNRRSLERIEELTEDTEPTEQSSESNEKSSDSQYESETESDFDYTHPDFEDKLDGYMERFRDKTDELIRSKLSREEVLNRVNNNVESTRDTHSHSSLLQSSINAPNLKARRKSIHPGSVPVGLPLLPVSDMQVAENSSVSNSKNIQTDLLNSISVDHKSLTSLEPYKELKMLFTESDSKKNKIKKVLLDLEGANKRMEELQHTIQIKEQFIKDMIKNSDTRASAKQRFQRKWSKLEEEYFKTRIQLTQAKYALETARKEGGDDMMTKLKSDVEKYKNLARHYEKRLIDIELIKKIAGDSAKKVLELENSLQSSKKQMEKLKKQLKKEEELKHKLEEELMEDQKKMKTIEEKYNLKANKLLEENKNLVMETGSGERKRWIAEETERLAIMRDSSQRLHKQVTQKTSDDSQDVSFKEQTSQEKQKVKPLQTDESSDDHEYLRKEIGSLRDSRLLLLDQRSKLEEKYKKDQLLSSTEERLYLECEETIEAIDATIEFKNELICGRKHERQRDKSEKELMDTLIKLTSDEMRTLLYKYFKRVIDLKVNGRKIEQQLDQTEAECTNHMWKIRELSHALQAERLEAERQIVALQREHQEKLHLMLRHFAEESSSSGNEAGRHLVIARDNDVAKLKRENKNLKRRLQEMEALMQAAAASRTVIRRRSRSASPDPPLKQLPALPSTSSSSKVTRLTRQKNKVIIQFDSSKKKVTRHDLVPFNARR